MTVLTSLTLCLVSYLQLAWIHLWVLTLLQSHIHLQILTFLRIHLLNPHFNLLLLQLDFLDSFAISIKSMKSKSENKHEQPKSHPYLTSPFFLWCDIEFRFLKLWFNIESFMFFKKYMTFLRLNLNKTFLLDQDRMIKRSVAPTAILLTPQIFVLFFESINLSFHLLNLTLLPLSIVLRVDFWPLFLTTEIDRLAVVGLNEVIKEVILGEVWKLGEVMIGHTRGLLHDIDRSLFIRHELITHQ